MSNSERSFCEQCPIPDEGRQTADGGLVCAWKALGAVGALELIGKEIEGEGFNHPDNAGGKVLSMEIEYTLAATACAEGVQRGEPPVIQY